jgi:hypothetical protein
MTFFFAPKKPLYFSIFSILKNFKPKKEKFLKKMFPGHVLSQLGHGLSRHLFGWQD